MVRLRQKCAAVLVCLSLVLDLSAALAIGFAEAQPSEYQVEAAFLLNFTRFVAWPAEAFADADAPLAICVLGTDPFGIELDRVVEGESVNGRRLSVQRLRAAPAPKTCQVLFVSASETAPAKLLHGLNRGVLTVGEGENFLRSGGMIAFVIEDRRVRFTVNLGAAERGDLKLSSKLLTVARSVQK